MNMVQVLKDAGFNIKPISDAEYKRLCMQYPHKRVKTVRIPTKAKARRDAIVPVSAVYGKERIRDANGEPWNVTADTTGQATFVALV